MLQRELDDLARLCYQAAQREDTRILVRQMSRFHDTEDACELIVNGLRSYLKSRRNDTGVRIERDVQAGKVPHDSLALVRLCLVVEELVLNSRNHGDGRDGLEVVVGKDGDRLVIQVLEQEPGASPPGKLVDLSDRELRPYVELLRLGERGGGSQLLDNISEHLGLEVRCTSLQGRKKAYLIVCHHHPDSRRGDTHAAHEGVVRGRRP